MSQPQPIIIKRVKKSGGHGHHGGAWKIAYADFVTAMMAFFLLMWLLGNTTEEQRRGIADYFENPLSLANRSGQSLSDPSSPIQGGGEDPRFVDGEVAYADLTPVELETLLIEQERIELENLKSRIEQAIDAIPTLEQYREQLLLDLTDEGLRIQIIDLEARPMFELGSSQLQPYARSILRELTGLINQVGNRISISGHTDSAPFAAGEGGYSNWELSNDRANAARRELVTSGLAPEKVLRIVGLASTALLDPDDPLNAINRRISIVLINRTTEQAFLREHYGSESGPNPQQDDD